LLYRDASGGEAAVEVPPEGVFLGRGNDCAVRTDDAMVSRKNCRISLQAGRWVAEDLGSSNGTFVNGVRVQKQVLTHADVVRCGTLQVRFVETVPPQQRQQPPDVQPSVDPGALLADRDQKLRDSNDARDRLRSELESMQQKLDQTARDKATLLRENTSLQAEVEVQMRISDTLRLELEAFREKTASAQTRIEELEAELRLARAAAVDLKARAEMAELPMLGGPTAPTAALGGPTAPQSALGGPTAPQPALGGITAPMVVTSGTILGLGGNTKPFPSVTTPPAPVTTVPEMPAVDAVVVASATVENALAELRASLAVARNLVAEPGVVVPATARAVVVALENSQKRADEALDKIRALRDVAR
jgi:pSer/pThr/pTyr-binding forkhead associated (FHA) protein